MAGEGGANLLDCGLVPLLYAQQAQPWLGRVNNNVHGKKVMIG